MKQLREEFGDRIDYGTETDTWRMTFYVSYLKLRGYLHNAYAWLYNALCAPYSGLKLEYQRISKRPLLSPLHGLFMSSSLHILPEFLTIVFFGNCVCLCVCLCVFVCAFVQFNQSIFRA